MPMVKREVKTSAHREFPTTRAEVRVIGPFPFLVIMHHLCFGHASAIYDRTLPLQAPEQPPIFAGTDRSRFHDLLSFLTRHYLISGTTPASHHCRYRLHVIIITIQGHDYPKQQVPRGYNIDGYEPILHTGTNRNSPITPAQPIYAPLADTWKVALLSTLVRDYYEAVERPRYLALPFEAHDRVVDLRFGFDLQINAPSLGNRGCLAWRLLK
jgi:hypothetical protein